MFYDENNIQEIIKIKNKYGENCGVRVRADNETSTTAERGRSEHLMTSVVSGFPTAEADVFCVSAHSSTL